MLQPSSSSAGPRPPSPTNNRKGKGRRGGKQKNDDPSASGFPNSGSNSKKSKQTPRFANVPMFAELLELREDDSEVWDVSPEIAMTQSNFDHDGRTARVEQLEHRRRYLPADLESGWVALAPIPAGKRCLAVSHQHHGMFSKYEGAHRDFALALSEFRNNGSNVMVPSYEHTPSFPPQRHPIIEISVQSSAR